MSGSDAVKSFETLDVQVKALEGDVRDIKTSIAGLGNEVRQAMASITSQFTQQIEATNTKFASQMASLTTQFAQQQRTPWGSIGSVGGAVLALIGFMVFQTITPMQTDIKTLKEEIVPRVEHNYRQEATNRQFDEIERRLEQGQNRKYDEMSKTIDRLDSENRELKRK